MTANRLTCCDCHAESPIPDSPYRLRVCTSCKSLRTLFIRPPRIKLPTLRSYTYYHVRGG